MGERLTWEEIKEKYPDKWVGLSQIDWEDAANVRSAVVSYTDKSSYELWKMRKSGEDVFGIYTTPDNVCPLGFSLELA
jgi:hypothetical protein